MKKLFLLILVLALALGCFASCDMLPESVQDGIDSVLGMVGLGGDDADDTADDTTDDTTDDETDAPHVHEFVTETKQPNCSLPGKETKTCACGVVEVNEIGEALGHNYKVVSVTEPSCNSTGGTKYKCSRCGYSYTDTTPATGHNFGPLVESSRLIPCLNDFCSYAKLPDGNGKYNDVIVYKLTDEDLAAFDSIFAELDLIISAADAYDPALHGYAEGSATHDAYLVMEAKYEELYDVLEYVVMQQQVAQLEYYVNMNDSVKKDNFDYASQVRTDLVSRFYSFSSPIYDSMYRDYYYYGMSEEEILAFIFESDTISNPEYKALLDRNNEIELEFLEIGTPATSELVPTLYAEFVENNKKMATLMGYENYLEYAYENVYSRDYSYEDVQTIVNYVKKYLASSYLSIYGKWSSITGSNLTDSAYATYLTYIEESFFTNYESNKAVNDYIDLLAFTSNADKNITFSDELNGLMADGNLFRGQYSGAFVTSLYGIDLPIAYFGQTYSDSFTLVHEFGHYMNEVYSGGKYSQSYDLLEMHSQGNEMLYLAYLKSLNGQIPKDGIEIVETYQLLVLLDSIMNALAVDTFEQAVYTDTYSGTYSDEIMADGVITADEYDLLYSGIIADFGGTGLMPDTYWRYMTITSPCYYVSYSVSAISVLQLYIMGSEDFDAAADAYLKLFTYVDEYELGADYMSMEDVLEYAGLYSYTDERLYKMYSSALK